MRWLQRLLGRTAFSPTPTPTRAPQRSDGLPFRFLVEDVFVITGRGTVVTGTVQSGEGRVGDSVLVGAVPSVIDQIEVLGASVATTRTGEKNGLMFVGITQPTVVGTGV